MAQKLRIDFVSDVACPWCVVGLRSLERELEKLPADVEVELHFQPFELNPKMPREGQDMAEHLMQKYGMGREQLARNQQAIRDRGADLGFDFALDKRTRIYNTFDAHRLLHWADVEFPDRALALKHALFASYFTEGGDVSDADTLVAVAARAGLDPTRAREILASDEYADDVRQQSQYWLSQGITAVPSVIFNDRHLMQGGQPVEVFESALKQVLAADR